MPILITIVVAVQTLIAAFGDATRQAPGSRPLEPMGLAGRVLHADLPVPGATVSAARGDQRVRVITGEDGVFRFTTLEAGAWTITVEMRGFATVTREVIVPPSDAALAITLTVRTYAEMIGEGAVVRTGWPQVSTGQPVPPKPGEPPESRATSESAPEILNGSVVNGAATRFALPRAAGNNRPRGPSLYSGSVTGNFGNSAWDARPYAFGGSPAPSPAHSNVQIGFTVGGPVRVPFPSKWLQQVRLIYSRSVQHSANTRSALVPTFDERRGNLAGRTGVIRDPLTGLPFDGNVIPTQRIVPQAAALLDFYPKPTGAIRTGANFERPMLTTSTSDRVQVDVSQNSARTQLTGSVSYQRTLADPVNLFGFEDRTRQPSIRASASLTRRMTLRMNVRGVYEFVASESTTTPFFANRINVSGDAGIIGNAQDPLNWGPPTIAFPDIADLTDGRYQRSSRQSHVMSGQVQWRRGMHNISFGGDARLNAVNLHTHPDPRGTLSFTGAATGDAFADFLLGIPTTSAIAFGSLRTRIRGGQLSAFFDDDLRIAPGLTVALGVRWEYETPYDEREGRLANLDVLPGFTAAAPVVGADPTSPLTGTHFPATLVRRDALGFEPRVGLSWRPILTSSLIIKGGYGLYRNLGVYQSIAATLAQQPPFSSTSNLYNGVDTPLTLANPFPATQGNTTTFAVDPNFRTALLHSWQVTVQRDLPGSLTVVAAYFGDRGTRLAQAFLPNTYAPGGTNPCVSCPSGFRYLTSGGSSTRNAAQLILRRRLYAGLTAMATYTLAKSTDNAATFSNTNVSPESLSVAQDWLDLEAERGPSAFDQRHLVALEVQYTTGAGVRGGTLVDSFWGTLFKDWTVTAQLNTGSGLPITPLMFVAVPGTGIVGVRPSLTGAPVAAEDQGAYANPAAFTTPAPGTWGNAGRHSSRGPSTFTFDMSLARTIRFNRRLALDWRLSATNVLNRVTFVAVDRIISSPQFGQPTTASQMRRIVTSFALKF